VEGGMAGPRRELKLRAGKERGKNVCLIKKSQKSQTVKQPGAWVFLHSAVVERRKINERKGMIFYRV
jgi:hypothetical protein